LIVQLARADLRAALDLVASVAAAEGPDPFPLSVVSGLQRLVDADAGGYVETTVPGGFRSHVLVTQPQPPWLFDVLAQVGRGDPTHAVYCHARTEPIAISDVLSRSEFQRLPLYRLAGEPLGVEDCLRLYLPAPNGVARFFFFDRSRRGFPVRARALLTLLRPHLALARQRWIREIGAMRPGSLTPRESEVLRWVACGATNAEIARELWITEHTVRKHLENTYEKLGVHTRTAAVARAAASPIEPRVERSPAQG